MKFLSLFAAAILAGVVSASAIPEQHETLAMLSKRATIHLETLAKRGGYPYQDCGEDCGNHGGNHGERYEGKYDEDDYPYQDDDCKEDCEDYPKHKYPKHKYPKHDHGYTGGKGGDRSICKQDQVLSCCNSSALGKRLGGGFPSFGKSNDVTSGACNPVQGLSVLHDLIGIGNDLCGEKAQCCVGGNQVGLVNLQCTQIEL